jgi:hypothetical protein
MPTKAATEIFRKLGKEKEYKKMYWYYQQIIEDYVELGNWRSVGRKTKIPWESCYSAGRVALKRIGITTKTMCDIVKQQHEERRSI